MSYTINTFIAIAIIAWILQILLGWRQITCFNKAFTALCKLGKVGVGRTQGRFKPKVIVAVAVNEHNLVVGAIIMRGISVFSRPKTINQLQGLCLTQIDPTVIFPKDKSSREALSAAINQQ